MCSHEQDDQQDHTQPVLLDSLYRGMEFVLTIMTSQGFQIRRNYEELYETRLLLHH